MRGSDGPNVGRLRLMTSPTPDQLAWVAGFWDGEGTVTVLKNYATPQFHVSQAGDEGKALCQRVLDWTGVAGRVHGPYLNRARPNNKPYWRVRITGYDKVYEITKLCWPWLSETKRKQAQMGLGAHLAYRIEHNVRNRRSETHCSKGHPYSGKNLYITKQGHRRCRRCHADVESARRKAHLTPPAHPASSPLGLPATPTDDPQSWPTR